MSNVQDRPVEEDATEEGRFLRYAAVYRSSTYAGTPSSASTKSGKSRKTIQNRRTVYGTSAVSKTGMVNLKAEGMRKMVRAAQKRQSVSV